jgi:hypothetical protein
MFEVHCPCHQARVLLTNSAIRRIENTDHGVLVHWRCWCGHEGTLRTGRRVRPERTLPNEAIPDAAA